VADEVRGAGAAFLDEPADVGGELVARVGRDVLRTRRQVVAAHVGCDHAETCLRERLELCPPPVPELGEAVEQDDQWPVTELDVVQSHVVEFGIPLTEVGALVQHGDSSAVGLLLARRAAATGHGLAGGLAVAPVEHPGRTTGRPAPARRKHGPTPSVRRLLASWSTV
jgi:hypothetical protein